MDSEKAEDAGGLWSGSRRGLDEDQLRRLRRIWASDLGACPRAQQYRILGAPALPPHVVPFKGTVVHQVAEQMLKGEVVEPDLSAFPEARDRIMSEIGPALSNLGEWFEETDVDLGEAEAEVQFEMDLPMGYTLVRKIDILTPAWIVDLKSGSPPRRLRQRDLLAMALSHEVVLQAGEGERGCMLVYLGGDGPTEIEPFRRPNSLRSALGKAREKINQLIAYREEIRKGNSVPCFTSSLCSWCSYRWCRGV